MTFVLVEKLLDSDFGDEELMQAVANDAGFCGVQKTEVLCMTLGHPVVRFIGKYKGHEVEVGGDLLINIDHSYSVSISIKNCGDRKLASLNESIKNRLLNNGYSAFIWSPER